MFSKITKSRNTVETKFKCSSLFYFIFTFLFIMYIQPIHKCIIPYITDTGVIFRSKKRKITWQSACVLLGNRYKLLQQTIHIPYILWGIFCADIWREDYLNDTLPFTYQAGQQTTSVGLPVSGYYFPISGFAN